MASDLLTFKPTFRAVPQFTASISALSTLSSAPTIDLRPSIQALDLAVRNQGGRGTCSVFVLTFLLEFMARTRLNVGVADLSEEYLNHASNRVSGVNADGDFFSNLDAGYQVWGIVPEARLPYQSSQVASVAQSVLDEGRLWTRFKVDFIKEWDATKGATQAQLDKAIAYLDRSVPVAFGGWWFTSSTWSTSVVNGVEVMDVPALKDKTDVLMDGHSVALVGYRRDNAFAGGGYFVFRNSWGAGWGDDGYGYMPFDYVLNYANDLVAYDTKDIKAKRIGPQAVARGSDKLDVFVTDSSGVVHGASWQSGIFGSQWRGWWPILGGQSTGGAPVAVVSRNQNKLDLFVAGADGLTYTAAWERNASDDQWRGWWNVLTGGLPPGGAVSAVSRDPGKLDIFIVGHDGGIYTAAWDSGANKWGGWWRILDGVAAPGSQVAAVARDAGKLDIFIVGTDGGIYTAAWDSGANKWGGWWRILNGVAAPGSRISAVARDAGKLDVFIVGTDGGIYTAAWDTGANKWGGWWRILNGVAAPNSGVAAVSRDAGKLDVFIIGPDGGIYTAAWDTGANKWGGWWRILNGVAMAGSGISAVARDAAKLDIFIIGLDGGVWSAAWDSGANKWGGWWRIDP